MKALNLHTDGGEFYQEGTVTEYVGYYNMDEDYIYSGRSKDENSYRLIPISKSIIQYKNAGGEEPPEPITVLVPSPVEKDYKRGWFNRYFARQTNDINARYYEIDNAQYETIKNQGLPFYTAVQLRWKISGPMEDITDAAGNIVTPGVVDTNNRSIKFVESQHPSLVFRLQNLTEFWDGRVDAYFGPPLKPVTLVLKKENVVDT